MGIDFDDEAAAAKRRSETRAARKIVRFCLATIFAGTLAAAMGAHTVAAGIGRIAAIALVSVGALGFIAMKTPHRALSRFALVVIVLLTALSVGGAMLVSTLA